MTVSSAPTTVSFTVLNAPTTASFTFVNAPLTVSHTITAPALMLSQFSIISLTAITRRAIAAIIPMMIKTIGFAAMTAFTAAIIGVITDMACAMPAIMLTIGEIAAMTASIVATIDTVSGSNSDIFSLTLVMISAIFSSAGVNASATLTAACPNDPDNCALSLSSVSFKSFAASKSSWLIIKPLSAASSPRAFNALPPSSRMPANSSALAPNRSIAIMSRSVSLSILPSATTTSLNISSVFLYSPFASLTATPIFSNVSAFLSSPFLSFLTAPVIVDISTSIKSEAYAIF